MGTPYTPEAIANAFIDKSNEVGCTDLTPMKLLKLVYISHGWYLGFKSQPLIKGSVQAWKYGPVIPELYHVIKNYEGSHILDKIKTPKIESFTPFEFGFEIKGLDEDDSDVPSLIDAIWDVYGNMTGVQLSNLTHETGGPWDLVVKQSDGMILNNAVIPNELIESYYKNRIDND